MMETFLDQSALFAVFLEEFIECCQELAPACGRKTGVVLGSSLQTFPEWKANQTLPAEES